MDLLRSIPADGVALLTLNRPERRNALTPGLMSALSATMAELDADQSVRAIVLTGAGSAFCAGLDLEVLGDPSGGLLGSDPSAPAAGSGSASGSGSAADAGAGRSAAAGSGGFWADTATPVIAAVNGAAVTGGLEIALQCDIRLAGERARFADTHARVGVMPGGGLTWRLPRAVGLSRAIEMSVTGRFVAAGEAAAWGLVSRVVPDVVAEAVSLASAVAELEPVAASAVLTMYRRSADLGFGADAVAAELEAAGRWRTEHFDRSAVEERRRTIVARGQRLV